MRTALLLLALATGAVPALADEVPVRPWAAGVSEADQTRALDLLKKANELLEQEQFAPALDVLRQADAAWDHPAIRYNMAVALINLDRPIDAYEEVERALAFGGAALEPDIKEQAVAYEHLLRAGIVHLEIECVDAATKITLDGTEMIVPCPGVTKRLVLPGSHQIVASKPGFLTRTIDLAPAGGATTRANVDLKSVDEATVYHRRWPSWKPWAVVAGGAALGVGGVAFELQSAATFRSYDHAVAVLCPTSPCSSLPSVVTDAYRDAHRENLAGIALLGVGTAALVAGGALVWLNRPIAEHLGYTDIPIVAAKVGPGGWTITAQGRF
jgi:hypothetical protein